MLQAQKYSEIKQFWLMYAWVFWMRPCRAVKRMALKAGLMVLNSDQYAENRDALRTKISILKYQEEVSLAQDQDTNEVSANFVELATDHDHRVGRRLFWSV